MTPLCDMTVESTKQVCHCYKRPYLCRSRSDSHGTFSVGLEISSRTPRRRRRRGRSRGRRGKNASRRVARLGGVARRGPGFRPSRRPKEGRGVGTRVAARAGRPLDGTTRRRSSPRWGRHRLSVGPLPVEEFTGCEFVRVRAEAFFQLYSQCSCIVCLPTVWLITCHNAPDAADYYKAGFSEQSFFHGHFASPRARSGPRVSPRAGAGPRASERSRGRGRRFCPRAFAVVP